MIVDGTPTISNRHRRNTDEKLMIRYLNFIIKSVLRRNGGVTMKRYHVNNLILLILAVAISFILQALHMILPFMFGPIIAGIIVVRLLKLEVQWPTWLSQLGLMMLGAQIGVTFTRKVISDIKDDALIIVFITVMLLVLALIIAYFFKKIAQVNTETAVLSVIPGALSQMLIMAEENKRADVLIVSLTQTSRIIFVVLLVPLIAVLFKDTDSEMNVMMQAPQLLDVLSWPVIFGLILAIAATYVVMGWLRVPTRQLLAPVAVLIVWNLTTGMNFRLDFSFIAVAQVIYMVRVGIQIANLLPELKGRTAVAIIFQNVMLIMATFVMVYIIHIFTAYPVNQLFLGAAPGGMSQIVLVALETHADVAKISSYHIFRIFFILFLIAPLLNVFLKYRAKKQ